MRIADTVYSHRRALIVWLSRPMWTDVWLTDGDCVRVALLYFVSPAL